MPPTFWERTKFGGRVAFDKTFALVDKLGAPVNKLTNKLGSEAFWPTTLDKESDKAARILRSFCKDGFYQEEERPVVVDGPKQKQKVLKKIPAEVIRKAKGLAIFTTMRTGLWVSGAGGSGVIIAKQADGTWSPPSGILIHTAGLGFLVGVDIYDCVIVINTQKALEAFCRLRCTLGGEISAVAGPVGAGGIVDTEIHKRQAPVFTYLKSRGFYAGVQVDGSLFLERNEENERFYGQKMGVQDILAGKVRHPPYEIKKLHETLKAAQGDTDADESFVPSEPPPGDYEVDDSGHMFGIPNKDDPDPYGVLQLEKEGMVIREAGTKQRASWEQFTFAPSPTSPLYGTFDKKGTSRESTSSKGPSTRSSWVTGTTAATTNGSRESAEKERPAMVSMATQTDDLPPPPSPNRSVRSHRTNSLRQRPSMEYIPENGIIPHSPTGSSPSRITRRISGRSTLSRRTTPPSRTSSPLTASPHKTTRRHENLDDADAEDTEEDTEHTIEEPVVHQVQKASAPQVITRAKLVSVPKRVPPRLPPRNPNRREPLIINAEPSDNDAESPALSPSSPSNLSPVSTIQTTMPLSHDDTDKSDYDQHHRTDETFRPDYVDLSTTEAESMTETEGEEDTTTPEERRHNPWARILNQRSRSGSQRSAASGASNLEVPGGFGTAPTTPEETAPKALESDMENVELDERGIEAGREPTWI